VDEIDPADNPDANKDQAADGNTKTGGPTITSNKTDDDDDDDDDIDTDRKPEVPVPVISELPLEEEVEVIPEYVPFKETDYALRSPREKYQKLKELEDLVLSLKLDNVKVFVVCAGVFYGMGELAFKNTFKVYFFY
jgi:adenylate kinase